MELKGRPIVPGKLSGKSLVSKRPISFLGDIDPETGKIIAENHPLNGVSISNRVFTFPSGKGSTVGSYVIYQLFKNKKAPLAIINQDAEPIIIVGAIISEIPMVCNIDVNLIPNNIEVSLDAEKGVINF
ncbi:MAG: DUF126 domain-containing protein [Candidatus Lokiarchaeota archaeon]|nr:DUF126 domain-containing protein [Candidatus Lokiarchaeota archaeon]MBD3342923.1 DUF126 domain-containing protein [Candidatus Lokiarchaeota archaeon]